MQSLQKEESGSVRLPLWLSFFVVFSFTQAASAQSPEYHVKAAILYKFAAFVEWPATAFSSVSSPFVACVIGADPFGPWLQQEMGETKVGSHPVEIRHIETTEGNNTCHMAFISSTEQPRLQTRLTQLRNSPTLIVSDVKEPNQFCRLGGMICLVMEGGKVRFLLNAKAIDDAGLKIDSKLKRVAVSVDCGGTRQ